MKADRRVFSPAESRGWDRMQVDALDRILLALQHLREASIRRLPDGRWFSKSLDLQTALRHAESLTPPEEWGQRPKEAS
jgi:hypothetical protein